MILLEALVEHLKGLLFKALLMHVVLQEFELILLLEDLLTPLNKENAIRVLNHGHESFLARNLPGTLKNLL
jgi:hypothetical protein